MPRVEIDDAFDRMCGTRERGAVFQVFPDVHMDPRGSFVEVLKFERYPTDKTVGWIFRPGWIMQVNRSKSISGVARGLHAQKYGSCQAKLVEAVNRKIYDIIVDARPDSSTFGVSKVYSLDPNVQNMLFVPRGFLHGFVVPFEYSNEKAVFSYYCDNTYDPGSEITICPSTFMDRIAETGSAILPEEFLSTMKDHKLLYSDRDLAGTDYVKFMESVRDEFSRTGIPWYV